MRISKLEKPDDPVPDATTQLCMVRAIMNNKKMACLGELGQPVGKPFLIDLPGANREECLGNLDTDMFCFVRWW